MQISRVHADQRKSLVLFSAGAAICAALELAGVNALSTEKLFPAQIELPFPDLLIMAVVYAVFGIADNPLSVSVSCATELRLMPQFFYSLSS